MLKDTEPRTPFEKFLSISMSLVGAFYGGLIANSAQSELTFYIFCFIGSVIGYLVGLHAARLIASIILIILTVIAYSFRNEFLRAVFDAIFN